MALHQILALIATAFVVAEGQATGSDHIAAGGDVPEASGSYYFPTFYHVYEIPLAIMFIILCLLARPSTQEVLPEGFLQFRHSYLLVWSICIAADWLQGPYVYALYDAYGYSKQEIAQLFVAGFGSSLVFGCVVGTVADRFGRKKVCLAYCVFYIISCCTKHFNNYGILMVGRITGGIATSMLFSSFECWLVSEHCSRHKFSDGLLSFMLSQMYQVMYIVAIASGLVAQVVADAVPMHAVGGSVFHVGGFTGPFDLAILALIGGLILISRNWEENYGQSTDSGSMTENLSIAWKLLTTDLNMVLMAVVVSCFEGSMYAFVFNWTPALESKEVPPPHGLIFALFMMCCGCGSAMATIIGNRIKLSTRLLITFAVGIASFCIMSLVAGDQQLLKTCFTAFLFFEFCVGLYFPSIGVLKSEIVPENVRTTMYNIYRIPLNAVVVGLLLSDLSLIHCFILCAVLLAVAFFAMLFIRSPKVKQETASLVDNRVDNETQALEGGVTSETAMAASYDAVEPRTSLKSASNESP